MTWVMTAIAGVSAAANIGMKAGGVGGGGTTESVMGGVNGLLSGLMGSGLGGGGSMAPAMDLAQTPMSGSFMPPVEPTAYGGGAPGTSPWSAPMIGGVPAGGTTYINPNNPAASTYAGVNPASTMAPMAPPGQLQEGPLMAGGQFYSQPQPMTQPGGITYRGATMPTQPNPYMAAIGAAAPALSNVLAARVAAANRPVTTNRQYGVPYQTTAVSVGGQPPPARISPLERYRMMLAGMR